MSPIETTPGQHPYSAHWPTVIVLASGQGSRFFASGGTVPKLSAMLGDKTVLDHTLSTVQASGLPWHLERTGLPGMGDSIAAGIRATPDANGWLILPGDLPLVQAASLLAIAAALKHHAVVVPLFEGQRGHPVGFAPVCREQLLQLKGHQGALQVVRSFPAFALPLSDAGVSLDIDTVDDLERARQTLMRTGVQSGA
jgi:molybdenum cofactor cytidylyltransferase